MLPTQKSHLCRFWSPVLAVVLLWGAGLRAGGDDRPALTAAATPLQDDAQLHDVHLVGEKLV